MKHLREINTEFVEIEVEFFYPPIPYRGCDYSARYASDQSDNPALGWGETRDGAIADLIEQYDQPLTTKETLV